jgi:glyoxylase-like metal-dependent hydrolase (beta-lactamase superfamily II)
VLLDQGRQPYRPNRRWAGSGAGGRLADVLESAGVQTDDIDTVAFTHLNTDHIGWSIVEDGRRVLPRFRNARYLVPKLDWEYFGERAQLLPRDVVNPFETSMVPLADLGVLEMILGGELITPSLQAIHTPGHTPGHQSYRLLSAGQQCFVLGDIAFTAIDVGNPRTHTTWDEDPQRAIVTREIVLNRLHKERVFVAANHFPAPTFGRFISSDGALRWQPRATFESVP